MSIHAGIYAYLLTRQSVTALVGGAANPRIYPSVAPLKADFPRITFQRLNEGRNPHMRGTSGLVKASLQVDCWGTDSLSTTTLAEAVRNVMDTANRKTFGTYDVRFCLLQDARDMLEAADDNSEKHIFRVMLTFDLEYREAVPTLV